MSKLDSVMADIDAAIEKLNDVQNRLRELKTDAQEVERARDKLRGPRPSKKPPSH